MGNQMYVYVISSDDDEDQGISIGTNIFSSGDKAVDAIFENFSEDSTVDDASGIEKKIKDYNKKTLKRLLDNELIIFIESEGIDITVQKIGMDKDSITRIGYTCRS